MSTVSTPHWEIKAPSGDSYTRPIALTLWHGEQGQTFNVTLNELRTLAGLLRRYDLSSSAASQFYIETGELTEISA